MVRFYVSNNQAIYGRQVMCVTHNTGHIISLQGYYWFITLWVITLFIFTVFSIVMYEYGVCVQLMVHALASPIM